MSKEIVLKGKRIIYRNFEGRKGMFNADGKLNFTVILTEDEYKTLTDMGIGCKEKVYEEEGDVLYTVKVNIGRNKNNVRCAIVDRDNPKKAYTIPVEKWDMIDTLAILNGDVSCSIYDWEYNGQSGRKLYLQSIFIRIREDSLYEEYDEIV